jgi:hypothetical protein
MSMTNVEHLRFRNSSGLQFCKVIDLQKKIVEKPPRNSAGFCGGGRGLSWAVEPRKKNRSLKNEVLSSYIN